jgi:hypothetical protein
MARQPKQQIVDRLPTKALGHRLIEAPIQGRTKHLERSQNYPNNGWPAQRHNDEVSTDRKAERRELSIHEFRGDDWPQV